MTMKRNTHILDLYWEDILVSKILPYLTIRECFNFRCVSKTCLQIINMYFAKLKSLKLMNKGFSPHAFNVKCSRQFKVIFLLFKSTIHSIYLFSGASIVMSETKNLEPEPVCQSTGCRSHSTLKK